MIRGAQFYLTSGGRYQLLSYLMWKSIFNYRSNHVSKYLCCGLDDCALNSSSSTMKSSGILLAVLAVLNPVLAGTHEVWYVSHPVTILPRRLSDYHL